MSTFSLPAGSPPPTSRSLRLGLTALVLLLAGALGGAGTWAAFSAATANTGNAFAAGSVTLDNSGSSGSTPMLSLAGAVPGDTDTSCITVDYDGTLDANVSLYGRTGDGAPATAGTFELAPYLDLTVRRGTGLTQPYDSCVGFTADTGDYGHGPHGIVYDGTLEDFPDDFDAGRWDPTFGTPEVWTTGESHDYEFVITVRDDNAAQGLSAEQTFTWEARLAP